MGMQLKVLNSGTEGKIKRLGSTSQMKDMTNALIAIDSANGKKAGEGGWVPVKEAFEDFGFKICYDRNLAILTLLLFAAIARSGCSELISNARSVINQTAESTLDKKNVQKITLGEAFRRGDGKCIYSILNTEKFKNILKNQLLIDEKYVKNYLDRVKHITPWKLSESKKTVKVVADAFESMRGQKEGLGDTPPTFVSLFVINHIDDFKEKEYRVNRNKISDVEIPADVGRIPHRAFEGCTSLKSVKISGRVRVIDEYAFKDCKNLKSVTITFNGVLLKVIGPGAFMNCTSLENIKIPKGVEYIHYGAFEGCESLKRIEIPNAVKVIAGAAFKGCKNLQEVVIPKENQIEIMNSAFKGCPKNMRVVVRNLGEENKAQILAQL